MSFESFLGQLGYKSLRRLSSSSEIILCREWASDRLVVAKSWDEVHFDCATREIRAMTELESLRIAPRLLASFRQGQKTWLIRDFENGKTLSEVMQADPSERHGSLSAVFRNLTNNVELLHKAGWVHRDLSPHNILLNNDNISIIDWDLSEKVLQQMVSSYNPKGTLGFSLADSTENLYKQDQIALGRIARFLGLEGQIENFPTAMDISLTDESKKKRGKKSWWTRLS